MKKIGILFIFGINSLIAYDGFYAPYEEGTSHRVSQGYNGIVSHYGAGLAYAIDFAGNFDVYAPKDGVVAKIGKDSTKIKYCRDNPQYWHGSANYLAIKHDDGVYTYYYHLDSINVNIGDKVVRGKTVLGISGNTGCSTSNHLHFQFAKKASMSRSNSLKISFDDIGIPEKGKYYKSKNSPIVVLNSNLSIVDGAGSLIRTELLGTGTEDEKNCQWGCYRDEADMQSHTRPSTVSFQWKATNSCKKLKIGILASEAYRKKYNTWINPHSPLKVKIYRKKWSDDVVTEAFKTTLPKTVDYVSGWNNIIITSQEPLSKVQEIIAECTENDDGKDVTMLDDETLIDLPLNYKYGGQSSIIRGSNSTYNDQKDGIYQDMAIGLSDNKAMTLFQWQTSSNCNSLLLKSGTYTDGYSATLNGVSMKGWAEKNWADNKCNKKLPCTLKNSSTDGKSHFYIIKVKTNANALDGNRISAVCTQ
jgi:hypothetical protein